MTDYEIIDELHLDAPLVGGGVTAQIAEWIQSIDPAGELPDDTQIHVSIIVRRHA